jgi:hypothetical protein
MLVPIAAMAVSVAVSMVFMWLTGSATAGGSRCATLVDYRGAF